jgi:hypothetical protein
MRAIMKNICIALVAAIIVLHQSVAEKNNSNVLQDIPLLPSGIYLGMEEEKFVLQRPSAIMAGDFFSKQASGETDEKERVLYIESEMENLHRKAIVYQFDYGICSAISFEEYYSSTNYNIAREKVVNLFMNRYGTDFKKMLLQTKEPVGKQKKTLSQRKSPTLVWNDNGNYILLTLTPDEWASRDGIGKIKLMVVDEQSLGRIKLGSTQNPFPVDIKQAINNAKKHLPASKRDGFNFEK